MMTTKLNTKLEFEILAHEISSKFKKEKITMKDVNKAVKWARKK